ncbi:putative hotdog family 3-hydroxylacyl-ACP dehydratase [Mesocricetibacter intestinalis]|uniref:Putative hotdog family 3-hydroxylacyl-ACP dehydratase n=1 Tax=Mesocricetibacter intestinalis TaxID=1521930 RepID=A0A4V3D9L7_9PAST|nr:dehydratase [Mesocricetibacter intestinalis]TDQ57671.1 putative hotdog family 3-hydroxylacyl-ACP dehydratase [Mesocricetibacter intestinalis]
MPELRCPIESVAPLLPHRGRMILIDRVCDFGADFLLAEAHIGTDHILLRNGEFDTYAGIEIMAQGVAAWAGCQALTAGEEVRLGYLLGCRRLHIHQAKIALGTRLQVRVDLSIQDNNSGFGVFDCRLIDAENAKLLLEGALNVFSPK